MAEVVKRLRPRIVVPICVGSNPTIRPIFKNRTVRFFFYAGSRDENPKCVSIFLGFGGFADGRHEQSELVRIARKLSDVEPKVQKRNFPSVEQIQDESHYPPHFLKRPYMGLFYCEHGI